MKEGSLYKILLYILVGVFFILTPQTYLYAQEDSAEEIFWGDEEEDTDLDEGFDFSEDEEFSDDEEFGDDEEFSDENEGFEFDEGFADDDEFGDEDEDLEDFSEDFAEPEEDIGEAASRLGYTLNVVGASPAFVNHQLQTYNSGANFRVSVSLPMLLEIAGIRFRLGAEVGTYKFSNYLPIGGVVSGLHITGIVSFPAGPGQVKLGGGLFGKSLGVVAENSYGFAIGNALDLRVGIRSSTALNVTDSNNNVLGSVSWMDGILILGVSL